MLPEILAGPILRRTTKNKVCVWLATSIPMQLQLTVMNRNQAPLGQSDPARLADQHVQLGKNLHVYLLQARPGNDRGFPADELLYYKLDKVSGAERAPLFAGDELKKLVYGAHPHPSFFIPSKLRHLLHGSCRKPHGGNNAVDKKPVSDALNHGHVLLEKTCDDLEQRPAILLLTGDQIYADDVAISLLAMLRKRAVDITGQQEMLPADNGKTDSGALLDPSAIPLYGRRQVLDGLGGPQKSSSGFSSTESENHLLTFGEFAAMYLYAFGNAPAWEPVWQWEELQALGVAAGDEEKNPEDARNSQYDSLQSFHGTLPNIRRLLANVPTYMIFDDHDVTDDWNITQDWYDGVRNSALGRRIVANALAAYWAFQAWGNEPDNFDGDMVYSITQQLNGGAGNRDVGERYDLHTWKHRGWGFSIPTEPPIIAMDSRTQRQYDNKYYPAQLLDRYALDWLRVEWAKLKTRQDIDANTCPVFVATTPVVGFSMVENMQRIPIWLTSKLESNPLVQALERWIWREGVITEHLVSSLDAESWSSNVDGFLNFMDTLSHSDRMGISRCVFLSGDVHYSFTADATFERNRRKLHCRQLTSSALSNEPDDMQRRFLEKAGKSQKDKETRRGRPWPFRKGWSVEVQLVKAKNRDLRVNGECNLGLVRFDNGVAASHTLLMGGTELVY